MERYLKDLVISEAFQSLTSYDPRFPVYSLRETRNAIQTLVELLSESRFLVSHKKESIENHCMLGEKQLE